MHAFPPVLRSYFEGLKTHDVKKIGLAVADDLDFVTPLGTLSKDQFLSIVSAIYAGFPDWHYEHCEPEFREEVIAVKFRQGGNHTGTLAMPGFVAVQATGKHVSIPEHYFFYKLRGEQIVEIRPEPIPGGAPFGILAQVGPKAQPI